jgi:dephospho-CoA kinase
MAGRRKNKTSEAIISRDRLSLEQAHSRIDSQMPITEKCDRADIVLDNSSTPEALRQQVDLALTRISMN